MAALILLKNISHFIHAVTPDSFPDVIAVPTDGLWWVSVGGGGVGKMFHWKLLCSALILLQHNDVTRYLLITVIKITAVNTDNGFMSWSCLVHFLQQDFCSAGCIAFKLQSRYSSYKILLIFYQLCSDEVAHLRWLFCARAIQLHYLIRFSCCLVLCILEQINVIINKQLVFLKHF